MSKSIHLDIPVSWQFVRSVKKMVEESLAEVAEPVRYAAGMVASELVGNAIKYGEATAAAPYATLRLEVTEHCIVIVVANGVKSPERAQQVQRRIEQMTQSQDKEGFYLNRLQELLSGSTHGSQLGLYRIGYEGEFELSYTFAEQVLTVRATRGLP